MTSYKKFCRRIVIALVILLAGNLLVWEFFTRDLLTRHGGVITGDLPRVGYLNGFGHPRQNHTDLPRRHIPLAEYQGGGIDMVTLGDSFTNGGGHGKNRFYQDYIASGEGLKILNLKNVPGTKNFVESMVVLLNSGFLEELGTRFVLIELVERSCMRLSRDIDFTRSAPLAEIHDLYWPKEERIEEPSEEDEAETQRAEDGALPQVGMFNTGNLKFLLYNLGYLFSDHAFVSQVYRVRLDRPLFSVGGGNTLLFLNKDVEKLKYFSEAKTTKANDNLNRLARMLRARGIELYFMPAVNKYNLYREYIVDNPYPESPFFEQLRSMPREYHLIDTKAILAEELERGEMDIYYVDDTHWSWKASEAIFRKVRFN